MPIFERPGGSKTEFPSRLLLLLLACVAYLYLSGLWTTLLSGGHAAARYVNVLRLLLPALASTAAARIGSPRTKSFPGTLLFWVFTAAWVAILVVPLLPVPAGGLHLAVVPGIVSMLGWFAGRSSSLRPRDRSTAKLGVFLGTALVAGYLHHFLAGGWQAHLAAEPGFAFLRLAGGAAALLAAGSISEIIAPTSGGERGAKFALVALAIWVLPLLVVGVEIVRADLSPAMAALGGWPTTWRAFYAPIMLSILSTPMGALAARGLQRDAKD